MAAPLIIIILIIRKTLASCCRAANSRGEARFFLKRELSALAKRHRKRRARSERCARDIIDISSLSRRERWQPRKSGGGKLMISIDAVRGGARRSRRESLSEARASKSGGERRILSPAPRDYSPSVIYFERISMNGFEFCRCMRPKLLTKIRRASSARPVLLSKSSPGLGFVSLQSSREAQLCLWSALQLSSRAAELEATGAASRVAPKVAPTWR